MDVCVYHCIFAHELFNRAHYDQASSSLVGSRPFHMWNTSIQCVTPERTEGFFQH